MSDTPKVLIVEDEAIIARDIQLQLVSSGFIVTGIARSAVEALREIEETTPDLVLMDIRIKGGMDGVDTAHVIREQYALPVIYLTAHADDDTLHRAQLTEPFGYIAKPLGNTNLKAMATMALYKHRMERELESHRKMLSTVLQALPDAIVVADSSGEILFLNEAAEQITGWTHQNAVGKSLVDVAPLEDGAGRIISSDLLQQALALHGVVRIPPDSALITKSRGTFEVSGQWSVVGVGDRAAGVFLTLQDVTLQKREQQRLAQEHSLLVAGELARGVAQEFYALFDLIGDCAAEVAEDDAPKLHVDLLQRASQIGKGMSLHLLEFRESHGAARAINVGQYVLGSQSLLRRFCGRSVEMEVDAVPEAGYVMSAGNDLEQVLIHLTLDARQRVGGCGKVTIDAGVESRTISSSRSRSYVRLTARSMRYFGVEAANGQAPFPFDREHVDLSLAIVRAVAMASGGFTRVSESDSVAIVEVFLPRHESRIAAKAIANEYDRVILIVGREMRSLEAVQRAAGESALLLEAASMGEASLIAELYPGPIDLIVIEGGDALPKTTGRACDRIRARRPDTEFLQLSSSGDPSAADAISPPDLAKQIENFFHRGTVPAAVSATAN